MSEKQSLSQTFWLICIIIQLLTIHNITYWFVENNSASKNTFIHNNNNNLFTHTNIIVSFAHKIKYIFFRLFRVFNEVIEFIHVLW